MAQAIKLEKTWGGNTSSVTIHTIKVEEDIKNKNVNIAMPVLKNSQNTTAPTPRIYKLNRMTHTFNIQGQIRTGAITVKGVSKTVTAAGAKNALIFYVLLPQGNIKMYYPATAQLLAKADGNKADPASAIGSLMNATATSRYALTEFDEVKFIDPANRQWVGYTGASYDDISSNETNVETFDFILRLSYGEVK